MAPLQKQPVAINFSKGLDTKTDPFQVEPGKFLELQNGVFNKGGLLEKRNGFSSLVDLPNDSYDQVKTFNGNLTAIGSTIAAYAKGQRSWIDKGTIHPVELDVTPLVRSATNQTQCDSVVSSNNQVCTVYTDVNGSSTSYKYVVADVITGQNLINPTLITPTAGVVTGPPRVFVTSKYFIIVFNTIITAVDTLEYIAISINNLNTVSAPTVISTQYDPVGSPSFDGVVCSDYLYLAWNGNDVGGAIRVTYLDSTLTLHSVKVFAGSLGDILSVTADNTQSIPIIYVSFYDSGSLDGYALALNQFLVTMLAPTQIINGETVLNITSVAQDMELQFFYEIENAYSYDSAIATNYIKTNTLSQGGTLGSAQVLVRSVGLASKAFLINSQAYFLSVYDSDFQPTYFLINSDGQTIAKIAYQNAGGYLTNGLPSADVSGNDVYIAYLFKDLITSVNKAQGVTDTAGVYAQTGVNLVKFTLLEAALYSSEIGANLNLSGGFLWAYDGAIATEQNFHLYPDDVQVSTSGAGGSITAQQYFYVALYEWTDAQGNILRSAPSIPITVTTIGATSTNTIDVPSLRLTYKLNNPVKIVLYRWSTAQQTYYQVTSITAPTLNPNVLSTDAVAIVDTLADSAIIGNEILYTTGGVVENVGGPATAVTTLFDNRLFLLDAENKNLLWFSKQVAQGTPVEMSDLFTLYISPTVSSQGATGPNRCLFPMDDKLVIFKKDAMSYINGTGPDITGSNNQYSQPTFITGTVGCANQNSIVLIPQGIMFQSDKGIWLLGRDLSTHYIGADVQRYNGDRVLSAITIPETNQVRFTLESGVTLMYDYYYGQWGSFVGIPGISSVLYEDLHTFINQYGQVLQESPGSYLDGTQPVQLKLTTSWLNLAGLQGYQRAYFFFLLGVYYSPHKLVVSIAYDYNSAPTQQTIITPTNFNVPYGDEALYGAGSPYGGEPVLEQWQVHMQRQTCQAFQITIQEVFNSSVEQPAGVGLSLSGLNMIVGLKKGYSPIRAAQSAG